MSKNLKIIGSLVLGLTAMFVIAAFFAGTNANRFEVQRKDAYRRGDGAKLEITNISDGPISIQSFRVNERTDCTLEMDFLMRAQEIKFPIDTKIGDKFAVSGNCTIVRVQIGTDKGAVTYSFN